MITSCAPTPFMRSNMPSAWRSRLPSIISAGNLFGTTRTRHPGESFGAVGPPAAEGRYPRISGGVFDSFPGQNGQNPPLILNDSREKSEGRRARSVEMITQRPVMGSLRRSGITDYFTRNSNLPPRRRERRVFVILSERAAAREVEESLYAGFLPIKGFFDSCS